jgi:hypothetical protein
LYKEVRYEKMLFLHNHFGYADCWRDDAGVTVTGFPKP